VGTRPAAEGDVANSIATTVRPGYLHEGRLIRPQQVVAYAGDGDPVDEGTDDEG
jgi:hypothetical protein